MSRRSLSSILAAIAAIAAAILVACSPPSERTTEPASAATAAGPVVDQVAVDQVAVDQVASFDGLPISYEVRGSGDTTVVFVHGWSCDRTFWDGAAPKLADRFRVVAIDLGGHGASGTEPRTEWSPLVLAQDVVAVANDLDLQRVILVGHSMGGPVSLAAAASMPGRVLGVIGVDTLHDADVTWPEEQLAEILTAMRSDFRGACATMVAGMYPTDADATVVADTESRMCDANPNVAIALFESFPAIEMPTLFRDAGVPLRLINSATFPTSAENNRKYAPDFDFVVMDGVGHFPMFEAPDAFQGHLERFVEELAAYLKSL